MRIKRCNAAFSLIEMLVVVAVIAVLVTIVISVTARLDVQGKINRTQNTLALLNTALSEFHDYGYCYDGDFSVFKFPLDCNGFSETELQTALAQACDIASVTISGGTHDANYSECEAMYFLLNRMPACERTMQQIEKAFWNNKGTNGVAITFHIDSDTTDYPLFRFVDAWGNTLRYDYYEDEKDNTVTKNMKDTKKTFPVITSAGPDGRFRTRDDIKSR